MIPIRQTARDLFWLRFFRVVHTGVPIGWVDLVWDRWDADPKALLRVLEQPPVLWRGVRALS